MSVPHDIPAETVVMGGPVPASLAHFEPGEPYAQERSLIFGGGGGTENFFLCAGENTATEAKRVTRRSPVYSNQDLLQELGGREITALGRRFLLEQNGRGDTDERQQQRLFLQRSPSRLAGNCEIYLEHQPLADLPPLRGPDARSEWALCRGFAPPRPASTCYFVFRLDQDRSPGDGTASLKTPPPPPRCSTLSGFRSGFYKTGNVEEPAARLICRAKYRSMELVLGIVGAAGNGEKSSPAPGTGSGSSTSKSFFRQRPAPLSGGQKAERGGSERLRVACLQFRNFVRLLCSPAVLAWPGNTPEKLLSAINEEWSSLVHDHQARFFLCPARNRWLSPLHALASEMRLVLQRIAGPHFILCHWLFWGCVAEAQAQGPPSVLSDEAQGFLLQDVRTALAFLRRSLLAPARKITEDLALAAKQLVPSCHQPFLETEDLDSAATAEKDARVDKKQRRAAPEDAAEQQFENSVKADGKEESAAEQQRRSRADGLGQRHAPETRHRPRLYLPPQTAPLFFGTTTLCQSRVLVRAPPPAAISAATPCEFSASACGHFLRAGGLGWESSAFPLPPSKRLRRVSLAEAVRRGWARVSLVSDLLLTLQDTCSSRPPCADLPLPLERNFVLETSFATARESAALWKVSSADVVAKLHRLVQDLARSNTASNTTASGPALLSAYAVLVLAQLASNAGVCACGAHMDRELEEGRPLHTREARTELRKKFALPDDVDFVHTTPTTAFLCLLFTGYPNTHIYRPRTSSVAETDVRDPVLFAAATDAATRAFLNKFLSDSPENCCVWGRRLGLATPPGFNSIPQIGRLCTTLLPASQALLKKNTSGRRDTEMVLNGFAAPAWRWRDPQKKAAAGGELGSLVFRGHDLAVLPDFLSGYAAAPKDVSTAQRLRHLLRHNDARFEPSLGFEEFFKLPTHEDEDSAADHGLAAAKQYMAANVAACASPRLGPSAPTTSDWCPHLAAAAAALPCINEDDALQNLRRCQRSAHHESCPQPETWRNLPCEIFRPSFYATSNPAPAALYRHYLEPPSRSFFFAKKECAAACGFASYTLAHLETTTPRYCHVLHPSAATTTVYKTLHFLRTSDYAAHAALPPHAHPLRDDCTAKNGRCYCDLPETPPPGAGLYSFSTLCGDPRHDPRLQQDSRLQSLKNVFPEIRGPSKTPAADARPFATHVVSRRLAAQPDDPGKKFCIFDAMLLLRILLLVSFAIPRPGPRQRALELATRSLGPSALRRRRLDALWARLLATAGQASSTVHLFALNQWAQNSLLDPQHKWHAWPSHNMQKLAFAFLRQLLQQPFFFPETGGGSRAKIVRLLHTLLAAGPVAVDQHAARWRLGPEAQLLTLLLALGPCVLQLKKQTDFYTRFYAKAFHTNVDGDLGDAGDSKEARQQRHQLFIKDRLGLARLVCQPTDGAPFFTLAPRPGFARFATNLLYLLAPPSPTNNPLSAPQNRAEEGNEQTDLALHLQGHIRRLWRNPASSPAKTTLLTWSHYPLVERLWSHELHALERHALAARTSPHLYPSSSSGEPSSYTTPPLLLQTQVHNHARNTHALLCWLLTPAVARTLATNSSSHPGSGGAPANSRALLLISEKEPAADAAPCPSRAAHEQQHQRYAAAARGPGQQHGNSHATPNAAPLHSTTPRWSAMFLGRAGDLGTLVYADVRPSSPAAAAAKKLYWRSRPAADLAAATATPAPPPAPAGQERISPRACSYASWFTRVLLRAHGRQQLPPSAHVVLAAGGLWVSLHGRVARPQVEPLDTLPVQHILDAVKSCSLLICTRVFYEKMLALHPALHLLAYDKLATNAVPLSHLPLHIFSPLTVRFQDTDAALPSPLVAPPPAPPKSSKMAKDLTLFFKDREGNNDDGRWQKCCAGTPPAVVSVPRSVNTRQKLDAFLEKHVFAKVRRAALFSCSPLPGTKTPPTTTREKAVLLAQENEDLVDREEVALFSARALLLYGSAGVRGAPPSYRWPRELDAARFRQEYRQTLLEALAPPPSRGGDQKKAQRPLYQRLLFCYSFDFVRRRAARNPPACCLPKNGDSSKDEDPARLDDYFIVVLGSDTSSDTSSSTDTSSSSSSAGRNSSGGGDKDEDAAAGKRAESFRSDAPAGQTTLFQAVAAAAERAFGPGRVLTAALKTGWSEPFLVQEALKQRDPAFAWERTLALAGPRRHSPQLRPWAQDLPLAALLEY